MTHALSTILASAASIILLLAVLELVRRRRLREKYALLWILTAIVLLILSLGLMRPFKGVMLAAQFMNKASEARHDD